MIEPEQDEGATESSVECESTEPRAADRPAEVGGRDGPEPTRFGDWEKNGRCIDF